MTTIELTDGHVAGVDTHLLDDEGHLSVGVGAVDQMFADLVATW